MPGNRRPPPGAPPPDPFGERSSVAFALRLQLLGGLFQFETDSKRLLRIVRLAYAGLPAHTFARAAPQFRVRLLLTPSRRPHHRGHSRSEPPLVRPLAGAGILCGAMDGANCVAIAPELHSAVILVSRDMLRYPYHVRYELLEFAVYMLAARVQRLVPLHAACVGRGGQGVLLVGSSGAGKSTLVLHALLSDLDFLAEDSVLIEPQGLRASGVANFLHLRPEALRFLPRAQRLALRRRAAVIRRRSGVEKLELDLRGRGLRLAAAPLRVRAVLFLSVRKAGHGPLLTPLQPSASRRRLAASQPYAAQQPGWNAFRSRICRLPAFELRRGAHPREGIDAVRALLDKE